MKADVNKCKRCGQCRSVCPVYQTTFREADVARGKLALLESVKAGTMSWSGRLEEIISRCLLCGACAQVCASRVETTLIIQSGRQQLFEDEKSSKPKSPLLTSMREGHLTAKALFKGSALLQALVCKKIPEASGLHLRFPLSFFTERNTVPPIAWTPFLDVFRPRTSVKGKGLRIGFFVGCGANYLFPDVAWALVHLLGRVGASLIIPKEQVCCGLPAYVSGNTGTARDLAQKNIRVFESLELDAILTVCASCGSHLKALPSLFEDHTSSHHAATLMAQKHMDAMAFLVDHLGFDAHLEALEPSGSPKASSPLRVAYHDPCHLRIGQGITRAPRRLLEAAPGVQLVETPHPGRCCGHGGDFNLSHFSLSMKILDRRMQDVEKVRPDTVVTGCTGCLLQFSEGVSRRGLSGKIEVCHPLVLVEKAIAASLIPTQCRKDLPVFQALHTDAGQ
ncbi:MAG TPA: (Fe-S)-binding protein [Desulfobacterales bacterium]|nr:(Fe-S)-binding protein [Desulfobacterales bacterium]